MWKIYSGLGKGIGIQSTIQKLWESLHKCKNDVFIGEVEYVDFSKLLKEEWQRFHPKHLYLYKRKCFEFEKELRAIVEMVAVEDGRIVPFKEEGADIPVDLNKLVEKVWVSPYSSEWYSGLIERIMLRYNINKHVGQSSIDEKPS
jgi:hypothetical protein